MARSKQDSTTGLKGLVCSVCLRKAETMYCVYHEAALTQAKLGFEKWQMAFPNLTWERYLERILELEETGDWTKEVVKRELEASRVSKVSENLE